MIFDDDGLPDLGSLGLTPEALAARRGFVNTSEIPDILYGDPADRLRLARYHLGGPPEDLSGELRVAMGSFTEPLNLAWMRKQTGLRVQRTHLSRVSARLPWLRATLDGWLPELGIHVEAKHTNDWMKPDELIRWYQGQVQGQMICAETTQARLSVFYGNARWELYSLTLDPFWWEDVQPILLHWRDTLAAGQSPEPEPEPAPPPPAFETLISLDMASSNAWAEHASAWQTHQEAAKLFEAAKTELKALVPDDCKRAFGHGIEVVRDKRRALTVKPLTTTGGATEDFESDKKPRRRAGKGSQS